MTKPTLDQVADVLRRAMNAGGWIGECEDIATDLLDYIDGVDDDIVEWTSKYEPLPPDRYWWRDPKGGE